MASDGGGRLRAAQRQGESSGGGDGGGSGERVDAALPQKPTAAGWTKAQAPSRSLVRIHSSMNITIA
jgi:hypothetical protein